ncbi:MAG: hypothetical protein H7A37_06370 [Chlamydiales bacterium]|nr:hypothetical protein [Chlamydiia bacterium]MCP5507906.1 hypothetical protein [Chlamydiales bacterium]
MRSRISLISTTLLTLYCCLFIISDSQANSRQKQPTSFYQIITKDDWDLSQSSAEVLVPKQDDKTILLITENELPFQIEEFEDKDNLIILKLAPDRLYGKLRKGPGPVQYRLFDGCIPLDAVEEAKPNK